MVKGKRIGGKRIEDISGNIGSGKNLGTSMGTSIDILESRSLMDISNMAQTRFNSSRVSIANNEHRGSSDGTKCGGHDSFNVPPTRVKKAKLTSNSISSFSQGYWDIGDATYNCAFCGALFWYEERLCRSYNARSPKYGACCNQGKIRLPLLKSTPVELENLLLGDNEASRHYRKNIRSYNNMFSFTSMGGKIDRSVNQGGSPPVFRLHGQNYHLIGSMLPSDGEVPKFAQLYIYDTENEIANRKASVRSDAVSDEVRDEIIILLKNMLDSHNVLVQSFRMAKEGLCNGNVLDVRLRLISKRASDARVYNLPTASEVAALIVGDFENSDNLRDIILETRSDELKRISQLHPSYLGLQYPLLFPYGEDGYREDILLFNPHNQAEGRKKVSIREYFAFRLHGRSNEPRTILFSRRLLQQFIVDAFTMIESSRLTYIRLNQKQLRVDMYKGLHEAILSGDCDASRQGKRIVLPSTFTGGPRFMIQNYHDAMAICRWVGYPDLFLTLTCNPKWPEIIRFLEDGGLKSEDRPDILCRIFKVKIDGLIKDLRKNKIFGEIKSDSYIHNRVSKTRAATCSYTASDFKTRSAEEIDRIISAEIPDEQLDPLYFNAVSELMIHGPCGKDRRNSPCMMDGRCSKHFQKNFVETTQIDEDGYAVYRRRDNGRTIMKNGVCLDNRYVVPHNRYLLLKYGAHLNVEWCNQSRAIKYLFKYVNKGNDRVTTTFYQATNEGNVEKVVDEISLYYDCRYISSCEASWRIFGFEIQYKDPPVERLSFHLPNEQPIVFSDADNIDTVLQKDTVAQSMFLGWMEANKKYPEARGFTYPEFAMKFVWKADVREWLPRKKGFAIGRVFYVPPGSGDMYYLRCLLNQVRGPTSYRELCYVNGKQFGTFREACYELGLLNDDKEYIDGIIEASEFSSATSIRNLFATLLISGSMSRPEIVWEKCWTYLAEDVLYKQRILLDHPGLILDDNQLKNFTLADIEKLLKNHGRSLRDFEHMPFPDGSYFECCSNRLIYDEMCYDRRVLHDEYNELVGKLNEDQMKVFDIIVNSCFLEIGKIFFVYGYGGSGKTYVWRSLSAFLRLKGHIVHNVASSRIASLLLPGGRTAHSRFAIPFNLHEDSVCNIRQGSPLAELIIKAKLIIWDEAPMMHKHCFEALDRSMRDIMRVVDGRMDDYPFGGKTIAFGGDFRQILPVIPKGSRSDIVHASINSSYLWSHCTVLRLTNNMRLQGLDGSLRSESVKEFAEWIAKIGDGEINEPNDGVANIDISSNLLVTEYSDPIHGIVENIYGEYLRGRNDFAYFEERAILAPTLDVVNAVNEYIVSLNQDSGRTYLSSDIPCHSEKNVNFLSDLHTPEFINSISISGLPNHSLHLKVGTPVMLLRNIDSSLGLCNGTCLVITRLGNHVLEGEVLSNRDARKKVLIPRMSLTPSDTRIPFRFERRQFPLMVSYAMTINKSQGQSLSVVGLLLMKPIFCHGQLYVALSRVTNPDGLKILICNDDCSAPSADHTINVVFKEIFNNI